MEKLNGSIYDYPKYYDLIYGSDWKAEFDFLQDCFSKHVSGKTKSLFEPACGTGRLLFRLGKAGYSVSGNDLNEKAIEFCNKRLERHALKDRALVGDMTDFQLSKPVDAAFNTINSFRHLATEQQALDHMNCMAQAIRPGGIYVLGLHLSPTEGELTEDEAWSATRGHLTVNSQMWLAARDTKRRMEAYSMRFDVYSPTRQFSIHDQLEFRTYTARQFKALIRKCEGFEIEIVYDFRYDVNHEIKMDAVAEDVVVILKSVRTS